jgi:hypothetical protein
MKTTEWGPSIWIFLHTLIAKMNPNHYLQVKDELLYHLKQICTTLPCPECTMHATKYLQPIKSIPTKELFVQMLFVFHNSVNVRTQKQVFQYSDMAKYNNLNIKILYNNFLFVMSQRIPNSKMMLDVLNRNKIINEFDAWLKKNYLLL